MVVEIFMCVYQGWALGPKSPKNIPKKSNVGSGQAEVIDWLSIPLGVSTLSQKYFDIEEDGVKFALMVCDFEDHLSSFLPYNSDFYLSRNLVPMSAATIVLLGGFLWITCFSLFLAGLFINPPKTPLKNS